MDTIAIEISTLTPANLKPAQETLVQAFAEDPVAAQLFPDPSKRAPGMAHVFSMALRYAMKHGLVDVIEPAGAVAIWMRPEFPTPGWFRMIQAGLLATPFKVGWSATRRMLAFDHFIERCRLRTIPVPHWYLFSIGVRPDHQGNGLGAALIRHGLKRAQTTGHLCYLETANVHNLPFYQHHGFRVVGDQHMPDQGPGVWSLVSNDIGNNQAEQNQNRQPTPNE